MLFTHRLGVEVFRDTHAPIKRSLDSANGPVVTEKIRYQPMLDPFWTHFGGAHTAQKPENRRPAAKNGV